MQKVFRSLMLVCLALLLAETTGLGQTRNLQLPRIPNAKPRNIPAISNSAWRHKRYFIQKSPPL